MNNNIYSWHDERMSELKMQDVKREMSQHYIIKDVRFGKAFSLSSLIRTLDPGIAFMKSKLQIRRLFTGQLFRARSDKFAQ